MWEKGREQDLGGGEREIWSEENEIRQLKRQREAALSWKGIKWGIKGGELSVVAGGTRQGCWTAIYIGPTTWDRTYCRSWLQSCSRCISVAGASVKKILKCPFCFHPRKCCLLPPHSILLLETEKGDKFWSCGVKLALCHQLTFMAEK